MWTLVHQMIPSSPVLGITTDDHGTIYYSTDLELWKINLAISLEPQCIYNEGLCLRRLVWNRNALYICSELYHQILEYDLKKGKMTVLAGTGKEGSIDGKLKQSTFCYPDSINVDNNSDLIVSCLHDLRKIRIKEGTVETIHTNIRCFPKDFAISQGEIFFADCEHYFGKICDGKVCVVAGEQKAYGYVNGSLKSSRFRSPKSLILDQDGTVLLSDLNGVRKIDVKRNKVTTMMEGPNPLPAGVILAMDKQGRLITGHNDILILAKTWYIERLMWIGRLKEDASYCVWTLLPKEVLREITTHFRTMSNKKKVKRTMDGSLFFEDDEQPEKKAKIEPD